MLELNRECGPDDGYSFDEVLGNDGCEHCIESYRIKKSSLARAKKQFGISKRKLSSLGKRLIKHPELLTNNNEEIT